MEKTTFAAGCFWGVEASFEKIPGVIKTRVGFIGGTLQNPTYEQVCTGQTGHAEACEIEFDEKLISFQDLLHHFFEIHDPTTLNRQGPDQGTQYRSAVFCTDGEQRRQTVDFIGKLEEGSKIKIVTVVATAETFYPAEEYHQKYFTKNPQSGCTVKY